MKTFSITILTAFLFLAQTLSAQRQLVSLIINHDPDHIDSNEYYLAVTEKPRCIQVSKGQTFIVQSKWRKEGDSVVTIGAGTVQEINDYLGLRFTLYPGKTIQKEDMALFLVPLEKPAADTLFFKMARLAIGFKSIGDSSFYERNRMLENSSSYPTAILIGAMAADIRYTADAMLKIKDQQDQLIEKGSYKGQKLFSAMLKATGADVLQFIRYVYARPDKYKGNDWRISETFATWLINGAPKAL